MSDDVPNLRMMRDQQTASDAEYIAQLEGLTEGLERQVQVANDAADAAAEAVGAMAEKLTALQETNATLVTTYEPLWAVVEVARELADAACEHDDERLADGWVQLQAAFAALDETPRSDGADTVDLSEETKLRASLAGARFARDEARGQRDRLRAVVDAARKTVGGSIQAIEVARTEEMGRDVILRNVSTVLAKACDQLDGSEVMGDEAMTAGELSTWSAEQAGDVYMGGMKRATCRWCHEPIVYMNEQWVHEGPQLGKYATHQRACEPDMQSMLAEPDRRDAWVWICGCGNETAVTHCRVCGRYRPPEPIARERQRIWAAINAWEERGFRFNEEGGVEATDITHKPLDPFLDELRAMVFDAPAEGPTVSSGADSGEHPRTSDPTTDVRRGGGWETAGLSLADGTIWHRINQLADEQTGVDGNVIRGWLDTTVREALLGDG